MQPDLELVHIRKGESFAAWMHGYPFRTVRWHYHPEYEIHLVVDTHGTFYIGDHIGEFGPGQLIMTGPNLPQNWISDIAPDEVVPTRSFVVQFPETFIEDAAAAMPEMDAIRPLLERSHRGLLFSPATAEAVKPLMTELFEARGLRRLALFWDILDQLANAPDPEVLASGITQQIQAHPLASIDYIKLVDAENLSTIDRIEAPVLCALAVHLGNTRLIDNTVLTPSD